MDVNKKVGYLIKANGDSCEITPDDATKGFSLEELYREIGCDLIQVLNLPSGYIMIVDEEGRLKERPLNRMASSLYGGIIVGNVVVCPSNMLK